MRPIHIIGFLIISFNVLAQELPKNLVYANEAFEFERVSIVGENMLLRRNFVKGKNIWTTFLLNANRVMTDTMKMADGNWLIRSDSTFTVNASNEYVNVAIRDDRFFTKAGLLIKTDFSSNFIDPIFMINKFLLGYLYREEENCRSYHYLDAKELRTLAAKPGVTDWFGFDDLDTVLLLSANRFEKFSKGETYDDLPIKDLFPFSQSCRDRTAFPYYGWNEYFYVNDVFYMYDRATASVLAFDVSGQPKFTNSNHLPIVDKKKEGWRYFYDHVADKHYVSKRIDITVIDPKLNKRKARKIERVYRYELFELLTDSWKLEPLYKLKFSPELIDNDLVYEIVKEEGKGSALYFHPLDPNYKYEKSKLIYSSDN